MLGEILSLIGSLCILVLFGGAFVVLAVEWIVSLFREGNSNAVR